MLLAKTARKDKGRQPRHPQQEMPNQQAREQSTPPSKRGVSVVVVADDRCSFFVGGVRCPRRVTKKCYCDLHDEPEARQPEPKHCPICLESYPKLRWFECTHGVCSTCLSQMTQLLCPVCRFDLEGSSLLTKAELAKLNANKRKSEMEARRQQGRDGHRVARTLLLDEEEAEDEDDSYDERLAGFLASAGIESGDLFEELQASAQQQRYHPSGRYHAIARGRVSEHAHHYNIHQGALLQQLHLIVGGGRRGGMGHGRRSIW
jgi:hypothetical protein